MLTPVDKAIVAFLIPLLAFLNQRYGFAFPLDPVNLGYLVAAATGLIVYIVPNKTNG